MPFSITPQLPLLVMGFVYNKEWSELNQTSTPSYFYSYAFLSYLSFPTAILILLFLVGRCCMLPDLEISMGRLSGWWGSVHFWSPLYCLALLIVKPRYFTSSSRDVPFFLLNILISVFYFSSFFAISRFHQYNWEICNRCELIYM